MATADPVKPRVNGLKETGVELPKLLVVTPLRMSFLKSIRLRLKLKRLLNMRSLENRL